MAVAFFGILLMLLSMAVATHWPNIEATSSDWGWAPPLVFWVGVFFGLTGFMQDRYPELK